MVRLLELKHHQLYQLKNYRIPTNQFIDVCEKMRCRVITMGNLIVNHYKGEKVDMRDPKEIKNNIALLTFKLGDEVRSEKIELGTCNFFNKAMQIMEKTYDCISFKKEDGKIIVVSSNTILAIEEI